MKINQDELLLKILQKVASEKEASDVEDTYEKEDEAIVHPSIGLLIKLEQGWLSEEDEFKINNHIAFCDECFQTLMNIREGTSDREKGFKKEVADIIIEKIGLSSLPNTEPISYYIESDKSVLDLPSEDILKMAGLAESDLGYIKECLERVSEKVQGKKDLKILRRLTIEEAEKMGLKKHEINKMLDFIKIITS